MIAYHFPPLAGSSGIQRTLRFVQHLPALGWEPLVLSCSPRAYERTSPDLDAEIPAGTVVRRAFALDTARHLSIGGRYIGAMSRPDRWVSWRFDAVRVGHSMIREFSPDVIWSTYPIATAHMIGASLAASSGLPWVADFRDPMAQEGYPADPLTWQQFHDIERHAVLNAAATTFTTPGAARVYRERYPAGAHRVRVIENGYDEESFSAAGQSGLALAPLEAGVVTILHSGIVYPKERDPTQLILALRQLADSGVIAPGQMKIRFRAAVQEALLLGLAREHRVLDYVDVLPPVGYREALAEMLRADALLLMQAGDCNEQIPAKAYEYLRAGRPILCLSDPAGDTMGLVRASGVETVARIDDVQGIATLLAEFLSGAVRSRCLPRASFVKSASRAGRTAELANLLVEVAPTR